MFSWITNKQLLWKMLTFSIHQVCAAIQRIPPATFGANLEAAVGYAAASGRLR
jgi:hypothetical protein